MNDWRYSSSLFHPRLRSLLDMEKSEGQLFAAVPTAPLSRTPTELESFYYRSMLALIGANRSSHELRYSFVESFKSGLFLAASLSSRTLIEISGMPRYLEIEVIAKFERDRTNSIIVERLDRLLQGSSGEIPLPWGGVSQLKPINAMEFVRAADVSDDYDWLCNASHPSMLHHGYLHLAGRFGDNWSNEAFAKHGRAVLERLVSITEAPSIRLTTDTSRLVDRVAPILAPLV